ncbi:MAG: hypothetical protein NUV82_02595 [Candidatus Komeilibacteria bacterium]|nr:hypothetical protein [Candidatus Komeilibacteria bacterium]
MFWRRYGNKILFLTLLLMIAVFVWLFRASYFDRLSNLENYVPAGAIMTAQIDLTHANTTHAQREILKSDNTISGLYSQAERWLSDQLSNYGLSWSEMSQHYLRSQSLLYLYPHDDSLQWGWLINAKAGALEKQLLSNPTLVARDRYEQISIYRLGQNLPYIYVAFPTNDLAIVSSDEGLVRLSISQYTRRDTIWWQDYFSIISLQPILTIKLSPDINEYSDQFPLLGKLHDTLSPLINDRSNQLSLDIKQSGERLQWTLSNDKTAAKVAPTADIRPLVNLLQIPPIALIGYQPDGTTISNPILLPLVERAGWRDWNFSLRESIINAKAPIVLAALSTKDFIVISTTDQEAALERIAMDQLARLRPKSVHNTLPDGTSYTELVADPGTVVKKEAQANGTDLTIFTATGTDVAYSLYRVGEYSLLGTQSAIEKNLLNRKWTPPCAPETPYEQLLYINTASDYLKYSPWWHPNLLSFGYLSIFSQIMGSQPSIQGCLELSR